MGITRGMSSPAAYLQRAVLHPEGRDEDLRLALTAAVRGLRAAGTALVRPPAYAAAPSRALYVGEREGAMRRWLANRLQGSIETTALAFSEACPYLPGTPPAVFPLDAAGSRSGGLLVVWANVAENSMEAARVEELRRGLESVLEVEAAEGAYFRDPLDPLGPEISRALRAGDRNGLPALLTVARMVGDAEFAYWGEVRDGVVDVERHLGAKNSGFGFELPVGKGVGGSAFAGAEVLEIPDYLNCRYRYPGVSEATDKEGVRSTIAIPLRGQRPGSGAVLYAVRRSVAPFTDAQRALLLRLGRNVEPSWEPELLPRRLSAGRERPGPAGKAELRRILLESSRARDVEAWLEKTVGGTAISVDRDGNPYVLSNSERLQRRRLPDGGSSPASVPLPGSGGEARGGRGRLCVWPSAPVGPEGWPDLLEDAATALSVVIDRMEQAHDRLNHRRAQWIRDLAEGTADQGLLREGDRLGLPTDRGEVWAVAWEAEIPGDSARTRLKMLAEDVVLDRLGTPLTALDDLGIMLLRDGAREEPSAVRDALLRYFGPAPLWLVHGAGYDSFEALSLSLKKTIAAAREARAARDGRHVVEVGGRGLDALLDNPRLSAELSDFADNVLGPLLERDHTTGSSLTDTFCQALVSGSTSQTARRLFIHENTVRYRVRRAEQILGADPDSPEDRAATSLAAFIWLRKRS